MVNRTITHRERIELCLSGDTTDRIPVAFWRHFPVDDQSPEGLAESSINFQNQYDLDLIKVTPSSSFCLKDWGVTDHWTGDAEGTRDYDHSVIFTSDDWENLKSLDPRNGFLSDQLKCLRILSREFHQQVPILQTIFSPLAQAKHLVSDGRLLAQLRQNPEQLKVGLETITISTIRFIEEIRKCGIDGIFYAIQHAQLDLLSPTEYELFGKPYDLRILEAANDLWFNMLHLHGEDIMFDKVADYPVSGINWHDQQTSPTLANAKLNYKGIVCGGLRQWETMALGSPQQVYIETLAAIQQTEGKRFILGTGCVLPVITPHGNILAAKRTAAGEIIRSIEG